MALHHYLNRQYIQARVDHNCGQPYLVKVEFDPTGEEILNEYHYFDRSLAVHLLPLSNGLKTLRVERGNEWAEWHEVDCNWKLGPAPMFVS